VVHLNAAVADDILIGGWTNYDIGSWVFGSSPKKLALDFGHSRLD